MTVVAPYAHNPRSYPVEPNTEPPRNNLNIRQLACSILGLAGVTGLAIALSSRGVSKETAITSLIIGTVIGATTTAIAYFCLNHKPTVPNIRELQQAIDYPEENV